MGFVNKFDPKKIKIKQIKEKKRRMRKKGFRLKFVFYKNECQYKKPLQTNFTYFSPKGSILFNLQ